MMTHGPGTNLTDHPIENFDAAVRRGILSTFGGRETFVYPPYVAVPETLVRFGRVIAELLRFDEKAEEKKPKSGKVHYRFRKSADGGIIVERFPGLEPQFRLSPSGMLVSGGIPSEIYDAFGKSGK